jgi:hypothetical protein
LSPPRPARTRSAALARAPRLAATALAILALAIHCFVIQIHIHPSGPALDGASVQVDGPAAGFAEITKLAGKQAPGAPAPATCELCRQLLSSGAVDLAAPPVALIPTLAPIVVAVAPLERAPIRPVSHAWRSRAPPRLLG